MYAANLGGMNDHLVPSLIYSENCKTSASSLQLPNNENSYLVSSMNGTKTSSSDVLKINSCLPGTLASKFFSELKFQHFYRPTGS